MSSFINELTRSPTRDDTAERILDSTIDQLIESGLRRTSVEDVARRAGINRITIYRRFANRDELIRTAVLREGRKLLAQVDEVTAGLPTAAEQIEVGFVTALTQLRRHPLVQRIQRSEPDLLGHLLVTQGDAIISLGREYMAERIRRAQLHGQLGRFEPEPLAELMTRMTLSFVASPHSCIAIDDEAALHALVRSYLLPLLQAWGA